MIRACLAAGAVLLAGAWPGLAQSKGPARNPVRAQGRMTDAQAAELALSAMAAKGLSVPLSPR